MTRFSLAFGLTWVALAVPMEALAQTIPNAPPETLFAAADELQKLGKCEAAIPVYEQGLALSPNDAFAHFYVAQCLEKVGRTQSARTHYERVVALAPRSQEAVLALTKLADVNALPAPGKDLFPIQYFNSVLDARMKQGRPDTPELRAAIRQELNTREAIVRDAAKRGQPFSSGVTDAELESPSGVQKALGAQARFISDRIADWKRKTPILEADLRKEYEAAKLQIGEKEYKIRHVLLDDQTTAKEVIASLQKGESFERLAKLQSKDSGSRDRGGDLGWVGPNGFSKPFAEALAKIEIGQYSKAPVQTSFGWHVIAVDEIRIIRPMTYEDAEPLLRQRVETTRLDRYFRDLRREYGVP